MTSAFDEGSPYIVCELLEGKPCASDWLKEHCRFAWPSTTPANRARPDRGARSPHRSSRPEARKSICHHRRPGQDSRLRSGQAAVAPEESGRSVEDLTTVTKSGAVVGTVAYMSPEQLRGKAVDHRSDIFSVGAILYEMLTGRRAFRGETEVDTITAVLREDPPEINLEQAGVPVSFQQIVRHCLEKGAGKSLSIGPRPGVRAGNSGGCSPADNRRGRQEFASAGRSPLGSSRSASALQRCCCWRVASGATRHPISRIPASDFREGTSIRRASLPTIVHCVRSGLERQTAATFLHRWGFSSKSAAQPWRRKPAGDLSDRRTGGGASRAHMAHLEIEGGTLARTPLAGGSPREVLEDVRWADWDANGELAVVHHAEGRDRIEYPIGHVLYQSNGWISHLRFSPQADRLLS
jgi:eukaryotic-like serine/threonine-protein kinase